jgi:hypothetical protein
VRKRIVCCDEETYSSLVGTLFWLECSHPGKYKTSAAYFIFPNFIRVAQMHHYSLVSLNHGTHVYMGGQYAFTRCLMSTYSCNVVNYANSWWKTCESLNLQAFNDDALQLQPLYWKRLARALFIHKVLEFQLTMGCDVVKVPLSLRSFDAWAWEHYPKMLSWFIYLWSRHKEIIGTCGNDCSAAIIVDGHQKCRRRVCRYKNVRVSTEEFDELTIGCCRSLLFKSHFCSLHQEFQTENTRTGSLISERQTHVRNKSIKGGRDWRRPRTDGFGATGCRTSKAKPDTYIRRCSRSFGLLACVSNCRVIVSYGEIFRSETLREILHLLFSTVRGTFMKFRYLFSVFHFE